MACRGPAKSCRRALEVEEARDLDSSAEHLLDLTPEGASERDGGAEEKESAATVQQAPLTQLG